MDDFTPTAPARPPRDEEWFEDHVVGLRVLTEGDCGDAYLAWLGDEAVNRYLETRFSPQSLDGIRAFVRRQREDAWSFLFGIFMIEGRRHVGNIKIGPIQPIHSHGDVSYFLGDRSAWGKGVATRAVKLITKLAFERLEIHRCQAGTYATNVASARVLERAGYRFEGSFAAQLRGADGWEDHLWYGVTREQWEASR